MSKVILETPVFTVVSEQVELPSGNVKERFVVRHPGAVVILPVTADGNYLAIRQYRHSIGQTILEFPAGTLEKGEEPLACAKREIQEETGYSASTWHSLGVLYPAPGFCDEKQYLYLATDLQESRLPGDEDEIIEVVELSRSAVEAAIADGEFCDGKSLSTFLRADIKGLLSRLR